MICVHVCSFTTHPEVKILAGGRTFRFEFSKMFGPAMLGKRGDVIAGMPPLRSPFWKALECWCKQGHEIDAKGYAVYRLPERERFVKLAGRQYAPVPPGESPEKVRAEWLAKCGLTAAEVEALGPVETFEADGPIPLADRKEP